MKRVVGLPTVIPRPPACCPNKPHIGPCGTARSVLKQNLPNDHAGVFGDLPGVLAIRIMPRSGWIVTPERLRTFSTAPEISVNELKCTSRCGSIPCRRFAPIVTTPLLHACLGCTLSSPLRSLVHRRTSTTIILRSRTTTYLHVLALAGLR